MNEFKIKISEIDKVNKFSRIVSGIPTEMEIISGRYIVNAKSLMGIFSVDLTKSVTLRIDSTDKNTCEEIIKKLKEFIVEE